MAKRWALDEIITHIGKPCEIYYLTKLKRSVPRDALITSIHENANDVIATANLETAENVDDLKSNGVKG
jgi:hypothetical protein